MSEVRVPGGRRRRADAERSIAAILDAAIALLGSRPAASVEEIAAAAGVARQTVYAHYPTRDALLNAVIDRITTHVVAAIDAAELDTSPATAAIRRWLDVSWGLLARYPVLLHPTIGAGSPPDEYERHLPIIERLRALIERGQRSGEVDRRQSPAWLVAATIGLGHAAGQEVSAGRMSAQDAGVAFRDSVLRVYGP